MVVGVEDNVLGFCLAISSSLFIGSSFIIKKKGLKRAGAASEGTRASDGGYSYLMEPLWWFGMIAMLLGEGLNFAAYAYAPAILVTPLGALSIIFSVSSFYSARTPPYVRVGWLCTLLGGFDYHRSTRPLEKDIESVKQVWHLATEPGFVIYFFVVITLVAILIFVLMPRYGQKNMLVYIGICSLMGSLTVVAIKAIAIALKVTFRGSNQFVYFQTWFFTFFVIFCCIMQLIFLNKALDTFNTAVVSPVYYVMFTTLTIVANMIMFKELDTQKITPIATELCGFITILSGTFLLHKTKDLGGTPTSISCISYQRSADASPSREGEV